MAEGEILHTLQLPIEPTFDSPAALRERGDPDPIYRQYLQDVRATYDEIGWSRGKDFWIAMLVVFVVTIPFVLRWFTRRNRELGQRIDQLNQALRPYGVFGRHNSPPKGPASFEFRTLSAPART